MEIQLKDVIRIKHGFAFKGEHFSDEETGYAVLTPGNFSLSGGFQETDKFYDSDVFPQEFVLSAGDLIVTMTDLSKEADTIGYAALVPENSKHRYLHNQRIGLVTVFNPDFEKEYLYWLMRSPHYQRTIANSSNGATVHHTSPEKICRYRFEKRSKRVQSCIATILSTYDKLIEVNNKRISVLEEMAENLYKEWFVRFRFPGHESVPFENSLPQGWEKKRINELCTFLNGFAFKSEEYDENGEFIVVTIKNVQDGLFDLSSIERIGTIPKRMPEYCRLKKGDVLMSLTGNVARVCIVSENNCLLNQRVCRIESDYPHYSYLFFKQEAIYSTLCNLAYGTAQLNLSPILAGKLKVALPPAPLRKQFNDSVSTLFEQRQVLIEENNNLIKQRDLLLPRLMSGKLEV